MQLDVPFRLSPPVERREFVKNLAVRIILIVFAIALALALAKDQEFRFEKRELFLLAVI